MIFDVTAYGAVGDGVTDDTSAFQTALDAAGVAGGTVYIPAGVYLTSNTLLIPGGVHVQGDGRGASIIRPPAGAYAGRVVNGSSVFCTLAMVGVARASVRGVTVDHATNGTTANGIAAIADGAGTPALDCLIEDNEVLFSINSQYMIWNFQSDGTKIINNYLDGGISSGSGPQEGIETFGGNDVLIQGNTVKNIGGNGIYIAEDTGYRSNSNVRVSDNYIEDANVGIRVVSAVGPTFLQLKGNQTTGIRSNAVKITLAAGISIESLYVIANQLSSTGAGVALVSESGGIAKDIIVADNSVSDTNSSASIELSYFNGVTVSGNRINNSQGSGIQSEYCVDVTCLGNIITGTQNAGIRFSYCTRPSAQENLLQEYNQANSASPGVVFSGCTDGVALNNRFRPAIESYAIDVSAS